MNRYIENWKNTNLGSLLKNKKEKGHYGEELLSVTNENGIVRRDSLQRRDTSNNDKSKYLLVQKGDIAYNTMRMWQGVSGVSSYRGIVSPAYTVCSPTEKIDSKFAGYLLKDPAMISLFRKRSQGLVSDTWNLKYEKFAQIPCSLPPMSEQKKIAEIISNIENLISSLRVKINKHKIINFAYGKDLIKHKSKNQVFKIGDVYEVKSGSTPTRSRPEFFCKEGGIPWLKTMDLTNDYVYKTDEELEDLTFRETNLKTFPKGSVLIAMYGGWNQIGRTGILTKESYCNQAMSVLMPTERVLPEFINMQLVINVSYWKKVAASSRKDPNITKSDVNGMKIYIPSLIEQERISKIYCSQLDFINKLKDKIQNLIYLKSAISYELLSGRKRVKIL